MNRTIHRFVIKLCLLISGNSRTLRTHCQQHTEQFHLLFYLLSGIHSQQCVYFNKSNIQFLVICVSQVVAMATINRQYIFYLFARAIYIMLRKLSIMLLSFTLRKATLCIKLWLRMKLMVIHSLISLQ